MPHKLTISSLNFIILSSLFLFFPYNYIFIGKLWNVTGFSLAFFAIIGCIWLLFLAAAALTLWKYTARPVMVIFILLNAFCLYFMQEYNIAIDKIVLLNALQTDSAEAGDLLNLRLAFYLLVGGIIPALVIAKTEIRFFPFRAELGQHAAIILVALLLVAATAFGGSSYTAQFLRNNRHLRYSLLPANYVGAVISSVKIISKANRKFISIGQNAKFHPYWQNGKKNLIVLVIGETARAANFSLGGYARPTNAALEQKRNDIFYFANASSCGTSTAVSLPCMLAAQGRADFKPGSETYIENVLDVINRNGYHVLWRENNSGCKNACSRIETETFCRNYQCPDEILLKDFTAKIKNINQNTVVVLHQQGSHGPAYYRRYPTEFERYLPTCRTETLSNCSIKEIVNAYDNSIAYTSYMLAQTIKQLQQLAADYNVIMLYASDHGESLGENHIYLHAAPYIIAPETQIRIPMLVWLDEQNAEALHINRQCLQQKLEMPVSHDNIFHSLLGLSGISATEYNRELDLFASCRQ